MPYTVKKVKGSRPFQIINMQTRKVVGTSKTMKAAQGSIAHRMDWEKQQGTKSKSKPRKRIESNRLNKGRAFKPLTNKNRK